ncbi:MAG: DegT/DnrJ/EryC1/StrS family aminotransferase, partial [Helicobacteraceae bacterium]|nr:DegT/DnrJ/EryC1/StrS family aminotransferase [Helicobacteraceae bacterium]
MWLDRYGAQAIEADDLSAVAEALASGVLTQGASVEAFESRVASYCGAEFAIAVCNATAGLHIALLAAGVGAGDEVITTPISFAATANAVLYCGATPIFADIDFASGLLDAACVERLITPRTKAIIPVHYAGSLCDLAIYEIAARRALIVIEDAAHAIGSFDAEGKSAGTFGAMGVFSFHPVKPITTGEGGAVITNDPAIAARLRLLRSHGISRGEGWEQNMNLLGFNYRISDISCALGVSQIAKLDRMIDARSQVAAKYDRAFESAAKFRPLKI